jgi:phosphoglycolate phosphatase
MTDNENAFLNWLESNTLEAIIFDFDGILLDIEDPLKRAINETLQKEKVDYDTEETVKEIGSVLESIQGYPLPKIVLQSHKIFEQISTLNELSFIKKLSIATKIFSRYLEYEKEAHLFPEVLLLIKELSKKYDLYILSHNQTETIIDHLEKENCKDYFDGIFGADRLPELKPDPRALKPVITKYEPFNGDKFVLIGDMPSDIEAGREAGIWTIGIPSGISSVETLRNYIPDLLLESIRQLFQLFGINYKEIMNTNEKELKIQS